MALHVDDDRTRSTLEQLNYIIIRDWEEVGELYVTHSAPWFARAGVKVVDFESLSRDEKDDVYEILFPGE